MKPIERLNSSIGNLATAVNGVVINPSSGTSDADVNAAADRIDALTAQVVALEPAPVPETAPDTGATQAPAVKLNPPNAAAQ